MALGIEKYNFISEKEIIMKKVLSMAMLTVLATTLAVSACPCGCKKACPCAAKVATPAVAKTCPCAVKPAVTVKPATVVVKPVAVVTPEVKKIEAPVKVEVKKSFVQKLKFWAK